METNFYKYTAIIFNFYTLIVVGNTDQKMPYSSHWVKNTPRNIAFEKDCTVLAQENVKIPASNDKTLRIATYNVQAWQKLKNVAHYPNILQTIKDIHADILILEEATWTKQPIRDLTALFPLSQSFCKGTRVGWPPFPGPFGNALLIKNKETLKFVKKPTSHIFTQPVSGEKRCFIKAGIMFDALQFSIYGTHLDVWDHTGATRAKEIQEILEEIKKDTSDIIIVAGDFNAFREQDYDEPYLSMIKKEAAEYAKMPSVPTHTLDAFIDAGFTDSFSLSEQKGPKFTSLGGANTIDFIFIKDQRTELKKSERPLVTKSYVFYTATSDHIPVLVDISLKLSSIQNSTYDLEKLAESLQVLAKN